MEAWVSEVNAATSVSQEQPSFTAAPNRHAWGSRVLAHRRERGAGPHQRGGEGGSSALVGTRACDERDEREEVERDGGAQAQIERGCNTHRIRITRRRARAQCGPSAGKAGEAGGECSAGVRQARQGREYEERGFHGGAGIWPDCGGNAGGAESRSCEAWTWQPRLCPAGALSLL